MEFADDIIQKTGEDDQKPYAGAWTLEEKNYASALIKGFQDGVIPDLPDKATMRNFLAKKLGCLTKRISKKYERSGYNGRLQYRNGVLSLSPEALKRRHDELEFLEKKFHESRAAVVQVRESSGSKKATAKVAPKAQKKPAQSVVSKEAARVGTEEESAALGLAGLATGQEEAAEAGAAKAYIGQAVRQSVTMRTTATANGSVLGLPASSWGSLQRPSVASLSGLSDDPLLRQYLSGGLGGGTPYDILALRAASARQAALFSSGMGLASPAALGPNSFLERSLALQRHALTADSLASARAAFPEAMSQAPVSTDFNPSLSRQALMQALVDSPFVPAPPEQTLLNDVMGIKPVGTSTPNDAAFMDFLRRKRELLGAQLAAQEPAAKRQRCQEM